MKGFAPKSHHRGISLIEIAITLVILALLIALGAPSFQTWLINTQLRNSAESMSAGLQRARSEAVRRNQSVQFTLVSLANPSVLDNTCAASAVGTSWVVSLDDPSGRCAVDASDVIAPRTVEKRAAGDGSSAAVVAGVDAAGAAASAVTFNGFGRTSGANPLAQINVTSNSAGTRALRVQISSGGSVRMCDPVVVDAADPRKC
ncbi:MAG: GspH/FimT family pseudopilin [Hydrogenophaga sp.]|uniref:GspH/FimT family pseudopilin n=1 Tax=Hydrogenophaga sp. TaxID=1904254 RepID=UPI002AB955B4|nr:GspH/FimT family pseudopilin [Hydrogenophaga sp.]MDZ4101372.1 GspH/FimT family pseudopilin [Hydrogenophaga sp.]